MPDKNQIEVHQHVIPPYQICSPDFRTKNADQPSCQGRLMPVKIQDQDGRGIAIMSRNHRTGMTPSNSTSPHAGTRVSGSAERGLTLIIATACGLIAANVYYAQPIASEIGRSAGLSAAGAGVIMMMTQLGYGFGLLFVVPLGDLLENRRLVLYILGFCAAALIAMALSTSAFLLLAAAFAVGLGSVAVQVLVPLAAHLAPAAKRGAVVGNVMAGLSIGIMLSRPVSSIISNALGWRAVFYLSCVMMVVTTLLLARLLPSRQPAGGEPYRALLRSMAGLATANIVLRHRSAYHALLFAAFSAFWTTVPLLLTSQFHLSQKGIALFALVGVAGAIAAPIAGRLADLGQARVGTGAAMLAVALAFVAATIGHGNSRYALPVLTGAAVLLDLGVTAHFVLGQRAIFSLDAALRGRLNGLYMASFFLGGAFGSGIGAILFATYGWSALCAFGLALGTAALAYFWIGLVGTNSHELA